MSTSPWGSTTARKIVVFSLLGEKVKVLWISFQWSVGLLAFSNGLLAGHILKKCLFVRNFSKQDALMQSKSGCGIPEYFKRTNFHGKKFS